MPVSACPRCGQTLDPASEKGICPRCGQHVPIPLTPATGSGASLPAAGASGIRHVGPPPGSGLHPVVPPLGSGVHRVGAGASGVHQATLVAPPKSAPEVHPSHPPPPGSTEIDTIPAP